MLRCPANVNICSEMVHVSQSGERNALLRGTAHSATLEQLA